MTCVSMAHCTLTAGNLYQGLATRGGTAECSNPSANTVRARRWSAAKEQRTSFSRVTSVACTAGGASACQHWNNAAAPRTTGRRAARTACHSTMQLVVAPTPQHEQSDLICDGNLNKQFTKLLRPSACHCLQDIQAALAGIPADELDSQSVTALGSALARLYQSTLHSAHPHRRSKHARSVEALVNRSDTSHSSQQHNADSIQQFATTTWVPLVLSRLPNMDPTGLCACLHATVTLRLHHAHDFAHSLMLACTGHLHTASPRVQATVLWCVVRLELKPPPLWLRRWLHASAQALPHYTSHDVAVALWALARLGCVLPEPWTRRMLSKVHQLMSQSAQPAPPEAAHSTSSTAEAVHSMSSTAAAAAAAEQLWSMSVMLRALVGLKVTPEPDFLDTCLDQAALWLQATLTGRSQSRASASASLSQSLARLAHTLIRFQHKPTPGFLNAFINSTCHCMPHASAQELVMMLLAVCNWRTTPPTGWMSGAMEHSEALLKQGAFTQQGLVVILDALSQLSYQPPASWMHAYTAALSSRMARMPSAAVAQLLAIFAALRYRPPPGLHAMLVHAATRRSERIRAKRWFPALLSMQLLATGAEPAGQLRQALAISRAKLAHCTPVNLAHTVWALAVHQHHTHQSVSQPSSNMSVQPAASAVLTSTTSASSVPPVSQPVHHSGGQPVSQPTNHSSGASSTMAATTDSITSGPGRPVWQAQDTSTALAMEMIPAVLASLRQRAVVASPRDLEWLLRGLTVLVTGSGRSRTPQLVLTEQQLGVLLDACQHSVQLFDLSQLTSILSSFAKLGAQCGSAGKPGLQLGSPSGAQASQAASCSVLLSVLATQCLKLLLETQQQQESRALETTAGSARNRGLKAGSVRGLEGVRGRLLDCACELTLQSDIMQDSWTVLGCWRVLLDVGYVQSLPLVKQHQVCIALYRAAECEALLVPETAAYVEQARSLAMQMPAAAPHAWLEEIGDVSPPDHALERELETLPMFVA